MLIRDWEELSKIPGLKNIDYVISSNYARAMATAKYICRENNISFLEI